MTLEVDNRNLNAYQRVSVRAEDAGFAPGQGDLVKQALDFVRFIGAPGLEEEEPLEFTADPHILRTSTGAAVVNLHQQSLSIPLFMATQTVRFGVDTTIQGTEGHVVEVLPSFVILPKLSVEQAVMKAAQHVTTSDPDEQEDTDVFGEPIELTPLDLSGFVPKIIASFTNLPERPTVLERGPFGEEIKANLVFVPIDVDLQLAWEITITMPDFENQFLVLVDSESGAILYSTQLVSSVAAQGNVYLTDGGGQRQFTSFPLAWSDYQLGVSTNSLPEEMQTPHHWVENDDTAGYSTISHTLDNGPTVQGELQGGACSFDPANSLGEDQRVLNAFYYACYMHDFFYLLGFREPDGNFQQISFADEAVISGDRVDVRVYPGAVPKTASMSFSIDGSSPILRLGLVTATNRHTAFDSSVVFHEFYHGVSNRLVGGPMNALSMVAIQSKGLGEGLSDFVACTINESTVIGSWVVDNPKGLRGFPYNDQFPANTDNFGSLGQGRYTSPHNIGEICGAVLLEIGRRIGPMRIMQIVVDALKLCPANPSFLDMRNAILLALDHELEAGLVTTNQHSADRSSMWTVFAKFGMGPNAASVLASLQGIVSDFEMPENL